MKTASTADDREKLSVANEKAPAHGPGLFVEAIRTGALFKTS